MDDDYEEEVSTEVEQPIWRYDYETKRYYCLAAPCNYSMDRKDRFEMHMSRNHDFKGKIEGVQRGRRCKNASGPIRPGRTSEMHYARNTIDPEWRYANGLKRYLRTCTKHATAAFIDLCGTSEFREEEKQKFIADFVQLRRLAWESKREAKIAGYKANIARGWHYDEDAGSNWDKVEASNDWEKEESSLNDTLLACGRFEEVEAMEVENSTSLRARQEPAVMFDPSKLVTIVGTPQIQRSSGESSRPSVLTLLSLPLDWELETAFFNLLDQWYNMRSLEKKKSMVAPEYNCRWPLYLRSPLWKQGSSPYGEFHLSRESVQAFETLASDDPMHALKSWVDDEAIGCYLMILSHTIPCTRRSHHCWFNPSLLGLLVSGSTSWVKLLPPRPPGRVKDSGRFDSILYYWLPANTSGHWSLFVLVTDQQTCTAFNQPTPVILHFDSLNGVHSTLACQIKILLGDLFSRWGYENSAIMNAPVYPVDCPTQSNGSDCGVWTVLFARQFLMDFVLKRASTNVVKVDKSWISDTELKQCRKTFGTLLAKLHELVISGKRNLPLPDSSPA